MPRARSSSRARACACSRARGWRELFVVAAEIARQDAEFLAVLGDGAAGEAEAFFLQLDDEFLVAERGTLVLDGDDVGQHFLHAGVGDGGATVGLVTCGEEKFEFKDA